MFNNLSANLRNFDGALSLTAEGDFSIITIGTENLKVNSANGYVAIGGPATITSMLTVNGAITQSSVTSALLKTNASGTLVAAVAGTDYVLPSALSGYLPLSGGTLTGALGGTSATFSGDITIGGAYKFSVASSRMISGSTDWALNNNANTVNMILVNNSTYAVTLAGSLSGTNASFSASITPLVLRGTNIATMWTEYYYNTSTLSGYIGSGDGLLSGANASDFIIRSQADIVLASGNNRRLTISSNGDATFIGTAPILAIQSNTTGNIFLRFRQSADTMASLFYTNSTATFTMSNNMGGLRFNTSGTSDALNISSTGSATFDTTSSINLSK